MVAPVCGLGSGRAGARGANGSFRWTFYDPPVREDGSRGKRRSRTARTLDDQAWLRLEGDLRQLEATMVARASGTRLDATFAELAGHWLDPARHPDWSDDYAKKVTKQHTSLSMEGQPQAVKTRQIRANGRLQIDAGAPGACVAFL